MGKGKRLLIIDVAGLSHELDDWGLKGRPAESVFPAVTCPVQASFRTAAPPAEHGMVANGLYFRLLRRVMFWEQSAGLVAGERIWSGLRRRGGKVAMLFWQQSLGESVDMVLSPAPIHLHEGGLIEDCYCRPAGLYRRLCKAVGGPFRLRRYWGPMASWKSGDWIASATVALLRDADLAPDLCLTYLPTLDYDLQRHGPGAAMTRAAQEALTGQLARMTPAARDLGYEVTVFGDYAIRAVNSAVFPNRALAQAGLLTTRPVQDMLYPDLHASRAFAVADHQVAHVYVPDPGDIPAARDVLAQLPGVEKVMGSDEQAAVGLLHPNGGELVLLAAEGTWFAYPWWSSRSQRPDYAGHVDIHNKPGYDPCELRFGWPPGSVSDDPGKVRGCHGRAGPNNRVTWASTIRLPGTAGVSPAPAGAPGAGGTPAVPIGSIIDLARATRDWLNE